MYEDRLLLFETLYSYRSYTHFGSEVSHILSKTEETELKRMNLNVPLGMHNAFKGAVAVEGMQMTDVLLDFIKSYVADHSTPAPKKKSRRG